MSQLSINECLEGVMDTNFSYIRRLNILWIIYQALYFIPLLFLSVYRFYKQLPIEDYIKSVKEMPGTKIDVFISIHAFGYIVFYLPEIIYHLVNGINNACISQFFLHHVISLYGSWVCMKMQYHPWFTIFPMAFHSLLMVFPLYTFLNYIYLITIILCYYGLMQEPFYGRKYYDKVRVFIWLLVVPLVGLWFFGCTNEVRF